MSVDTDHDCGDGRPTYHFNFGGWKKASSRCESDYCTTEYPCQSDSEWAVSNGWKIIDEHILKEDDKIYEIIVLEKGIAHYDELELTVGPFLIAEKSDVFIEKWKRESAEWKRVLQSLEKADETDEIIEKKQLITKIEMIGKVLTT